MGVNALWAWIRANGTDSFKLTYAEIEQISGLPLDHSFLNGKKELTEYGYNVGSAPGVLTAITRTHVWYTEKIPMFSRWRVFPNGGFSAIIKLWIFIPHPGTYVLRRKPRKETVSR